MTDALVHELYKAHAAVALRGNPSHQALVLSAMGTGDYFKAIASAILMLGGIHGPLTQTYDLLALDCPLDEVAHRLNRGIRIPGWGNGFVKDGIEPAFLPVAEELFKANPEICKKIEAITTYIHGYDDGRLKIYPNPSCFTAATAITVGLPREAVGVLALQGRLMVWTEDFMRVVAESPKV